MVKECSLGKADEWRAMLRAQMDARRDVHLLARPISATRCRSSFHIPSEEELFR